VQQAEFVAFGVGEDGQVLMTGHYPSTQPAQPSQLGIYVVAP
jgi:hypothetical protein